MKQLRFRKHFGSIIDYDSTEFIWKQFLGITVHEMLQHILNQHENYRQAIKKYNIY